MHGRIGEVQGTRQAVDEGNSVQHDGRTDGPEKQVFQGALGGFFGGGKRHEQIGTQREQFQGQINREPVRGHRQQTHAQHGGDEQGAEFGGEAVAQQPYVQQREKPSRDDEDFEENGFVIQKQQRPEAEVGRRVPLAGCESQRNDRPAHGNQEQPSSGFFLVPGAIQQ